MDDPIHLGAHMGRSSAVVGGISMRMQTDAQRGQAVGSVIHMSGRMWGVDLALQESVVERLPTRRKVWATLGEPVLVMIGRYSMGFDIRPTDGGAYLRVWIDFDPPPRWMPHWLGRIVGGFYARWCVRQIAQEAVRHFHS